MASGPLSLSIDTRPDVRVLLFTLFVSVLTAFVFGLAPALRAGRIDPLPALKSTGGPAQGAVRVRLRRTLVVTQIAVSLVLLVAAGLFVRSLLKLQHIDVGFNPESVLLWMYAAGRRAPAAVEERRALYRSLLERAHTVPGVSAASASCFGLVQPSSLAQRHCHRRRRAGARCHACGRLPTRSRRDYFEVMRMGVLRGRAFAETDRESAAHVAIVNQTFARQFFGGADPIGRRVGLCSSIPCGEPAGA